MKTLQTKPKKNYQNNNNKQRKTCQQIKTAKLNKDINSGIFAKIIAKKKSLTHRKENMMKRIHTENKKGSNKKCLK